jgi:AcrR family transcriptional regulator
VTKGSYYHHFTSAGDFGEQVVRHWADAFLSTTAALPEGVTVPVSLLDSVIGEAFGPTTIGEAAVRAWAREDPRIRQHVERVDAARRSFLRRALTSAIDDDVDLDAATDTLAAMLVGALELEPALPPDRVFQLYQVFKRRYLANAAAHANGASAPSPSAPPTPAGPGHAPPAAPGRRSPRRKGT